MAGGRLPLPRPGVLGLGGGQHLGALAEPFEEHAGEDMGKGQGARLVLSLQLRMELTPPAWSGGRRGSNSVGFALVGRNGSSNAWELSRSRSGVGVGLLEP